MSLISPREIFLAALECKAVNVILIGLLAHFTGFDLDIMREAVKNSVPAKFLDINLKAFDMGAAI